MKKIFTITFFIALLFANNVFSATYNSAQAGNWNTDATWTEAGHPNANDDIAIITHAINYDAGESVITWGNITINSGGTLDFPVAASSNLVFNTTGILTINSGGKLSCGSVGSPLGATYKLKIHWPQGAAARNAIILNDGGEIAIFGNPAYYGSEKYADLDSDWSTGQIVYVTGDLSSDWIAGQKFWIHRNYKYVDYLTDADIFTIASVGAYDSGNDRTPITISEAAPAVTYAAVYEGFQSQLIMLSRNVELADPGSSWDAGGFASYDEDIGFDNNQGTTNNLIDIRDTIFRGWNYGANGGYNFSGKNLVFLNNNFVMSGTNVLNITSEIISNEYGIFNSYNIQNTGHVCSTEFAHRGSKSMKQVGDIIGNKYSFYQNDNSCGVGNIVSNYQLTDSPSLDITGNIIGNTYGIYYNYGKIKIKGSLKDNTTGVYRSYDVVILDGDINNNTTDFDILSTVIKNNVILENCTLGGTDRQPIRIYQNCGSWLPAVSGDAHFQTPPSGNSWILEAIPNSYCKNIYCNQMELSPLEEMALDTDSGSQTLTFSIYPVGWTASLDQDDVVFEVSYLDSVSGITRTTIVNSTTTYANDGWRDLEVTFNPSQDGIVYFQIYLRKYESGCYVLIDPVPNVN